MLKPTICRFKTFLFPFFTLCFILLYGNVFASHAVGSDISYTCLGNNQYRISLSFYRDCDGIGAPSEAPITIQSNNCGFFSSADLQLQSSKEVTALCPSQVGNSSCNGGTQPGIEQYIYTGVVTLQGQCNDWIFSFDHCCRNSAITNLLSPSNADLYVETRMSNVGGLCNSSPVFTTLPVPFICANQKIYYNHGAIDIDGDSLRYVSINPLQSPNSPITYRSGFNPNTPMSMTGTFFLDPLTGQMVFTPNASQYAVVTIRVDEYRNGVLIGSTMRDMQFIIITCNNNLPTTSGINGTGSFSTTACRGQATCFTIPTADIDASQALTITWNSAIPGATFTTTGTTRPTANFCWTPGPNDAGSYTFIASVQDNACPLFGNNIYAFRIDVGAAINVALTSTPLTCYGDSNATATANVSGGSGGYTYVWSNNQFSQTCTGLRAGTYTVTVTAPGTCGNVIDSITISSPAQIQVNATVADALCGQDDGQIALSVSGGTGSTYSYNWSNNRTTPVNSGLAAGNYTVSVRDAVQCQAVRAYTVNLIGNAVQSSVQAAICDGDSIFAGGAFRKLSGNYYDSLLTADGCDSIIETQLLVLAAPVTNVAVSICDGDSFFAGGAWQRTAGVYTDTLLTPDGCDSIINTDLSVLAVFVENVAAQICDGDSFLAGGAFQTVAGTYFDTLTASSGCDSIIVTTLAVLPVLVENVSVQICDGQSYVAGGAPQTQTGTYFDTLTTSGGCDSVVITDLTVLPVLVENVSVQICDGQSYVAGGALQTQTGTYFDTLTTSGGCDSIVITDLTVLPVLVENVAVSICDGDSFFAGGAFQTVAGTYFDSLTTSSGCDSVIVTELTVFAVQLVNVPVSVCDGDSFFAAGAFQTTAGIYFDTLTTLTGCDSIVATELTVLPHASALINVSICNGESYFAGGVFQTAKGTYFDTLVAANGCDSVVTTDLDVLPASFTTLSVSICDGDSYFVGGASQTAAGTYFDTLVAANGCDSVVATDLILLTPSQGFTTATICEGESFFVGGANQTVAGFYTDTLTGANSCDSILTTQLIVLPRTGGNTQVSICAGESFFVGGANQTVAGFYIDTLVGSNGCDSILTTELIIIAPVFGNTVATICDGDSYFVGGANQTDAGFYTDTLAAASGCDSILTTQLIVFPAPTFTQSFTVCAGEGVFAGGAFQTTSGTYTDVLTTADGCDSIVTTNLTVGDELEVNFHVHHIDCGCTVTGGGNGGQSGTCVLDFAGLPHGTILNNYFAAQGVTMTGNANSTFQDKLIVFNSNLNGTADPDLEAGIGNLAIFPENMVDSNGDGLIDSPDDQGAGGKITLVFDEPRTVNSFTFVDNDKNNGTVKAYNETNALIATVTTPSTGPGTVQNVALNIANVKKLEISYTDSRGITNISFSCPPQKCAPDLSGYAHGEIITGQQIAPGVTVTGMSNTPSQFPNAVAIFNTNVTGSLDDDLEVGIGNVLMLPEYLTDNNNDGNIDNPSDGPNGGKMIFTFDRDRTVYSITLVDNDRNNGTVKAFDANGTQIFSVGTPSPGPATIQLVNLNVTGVRRLELNYWDSRGVTNLQLDCPNEPCCDGNATANVTGGFGPYTYIWSTGSTGAYSGDSLCEGVYTVTITDQQGCSTTDSVRIVHAEVTTAQATICEGDSILLGGEYQTEAGTYTDTFGVTDGCYQLLETALTVLPASSATVQVSICEGQSYFAGGANQTESGIYVDVFTAANGCDSTITTQLTVNPAFTTQNAVQICDGQSYFAGGALQTTSGTYVDSFTTANGCDSILTTVLTVIPTIPQNVSASICAGQSYFAGGAFQTVSGTYLDSLTSGTGCDSIVITTLTVIPAIPQNVSASICAGQSYFAGGAFQTTSGVYVDSLTSPGGCDSIIVTTLTVIPAIQQNVALSICEGDSVFVGGAFQSTSGAYVDSFTTTAGCDSIVTTTLTVIPVAPQNVSVSLCSGDSLFAGGAWQTTSGIYVDSFTSGGGCDSIIITELTVSTLTVTGTITDATCFGASDGAIDITVSGGSGSYAYSWATAPTSEDITGLVAGSYGVTVVDIVTGCAITASFTVNQPLQLALGAVPTPASCNGAADGAIDLFVSGGTPGYTYLWSTNDITEDISGLVAGTYTVTVTDANNCQAILIVEVTEPAPFVSTTQISICDGESYFAGGAFQIVSGTYFDTLASAGGCDSIVTTELTVLPATTSNTQVTICDGESYFAGGAFQTQSGFYFDTLTSANGCDSVIITELTVLPASADTTQVTICAGDSIFAGGAFQTATGTYTDSFLSANGCDSLIVTELTVQPASSSTVQVSICAGDSIFAGGAFQTTAGIYFDTLANANGCDSIVTTEVTVLPALTSNVQEAICPGDSIFAGGSLQTVPGTYFDTLTAAGGCDSIVITELTFLPALQGNSAESICAGDSLFVGGAWQTVSGVYSDTFTITGGCDSIHTTTLTVLPAATGVVDITICVGQSYFAGGDFQTTTGAYFDTLTSAAGCDSIVTTNLTVNPTLVGSAQASICLGDSLFVGGEFQSTPGQYVDTFQTTSGCDSVVTTDLTVLPLSIANVSVSICTGDSFFVGNDWQTTSGIYQDTLISTFGCDSIVETSLTVLTQLTTHLNVTLCPGDSVFAGGAWQDTAGIFVDSLFSAGGCDSVVTTTVSVSGLDIAGTVTHVSCFGGSDGSITLLVTGGVAPFSFQWSHGTVDKDASGLIAGNYSVTVTDANGCSGTQSFIIQQAQPLAVGAVPTPVSCAGLSDGFIDLFVQGGTPPYTYLWSNGATTEDISGLSADTVTVIVTDIMGCQATVLVLVLEPTSIVIATDSVVDNSIPGSASGGGGGPGPGGPPGPPPNGGIYITVSGGTAPYMYVWSTGDTTEDISFLNGGTYYVTVVDANGCVATDSFTVVDLVPRQPGVNFGIRGSFDLAVYPNPFEDDIIVEFEAGGDANGLVVLRDVIGKRFYEQKIVISKGGNKYQLTMNAGLLASGVYILEVMQNDEKIRGMKILLKQ